MESMASSEQILEFIKRIMEKKEITCTMMAEYFLVDKSAMSRKLSGRTAMCVDDIPIYAKVLDVTPYEICMARKLNSGEIRVLENLYAQHKKSKSFKNGYMQPRSNSADISYDMDYGFAMYFSELFDAMMKHEEKNSTIL